MIANICPVSAAVLERTIELIQSVGIHEISDHRDNPNKPFIQQSLAAASVLLFGLVDPNISVTFVTLIQEKRLHISLNFEQDHEAWQILQEITNYPSTTEKTHV